MIDLFRGPKPPSPDSKKLLDSQEDLCQHVCELTVVVVDLAKTIGLLSDTLGLLSSTIGTLIERQELLRTRLERIDGRLDRAELYAVKVLGYPRTQADMPDEPTLRGRLDAVGRSER